MGHRARPQKNKPHIVHDEVQIFDPKRREVADPHLRVPIAESLRIHHSENPGSIFGFETSNFDVDNPIKFDKI